MNEIRTPDNHPKERYTDNGWKSRLRNWWGPGRGYRDLWLFLISFFVFLAVSENSQQTDYIQESRISQTLTSCEKANESIASSNLAWTTLQRIVLTSQLNPGDKPLPEGEDDPFKWTGIENGPLSQQIRRSIPGFPDGTERLRRANDQIAELEKNKIVQRNCEAEVEAVKNAKNG